MCRCYLRIKNSYSYNGQNQNYLMLVNLVSFGYKVMVMVKELNLRSSET